MKTLDVSLDMLNQSSVDFKIIVQIDSVSIDTKEIIQPGDAKN